MPVITTAAMIGGIVTYVGTQLAKNESLSGFFNDFTTETVNWIKPLFLKDDGEPKDVIQQLKDKPDSTARQNAVKSALEIGLEDNPNAEKYIKEIFEKIQAKGGSDITATNFKAKDGIDIKADQENSKATFDDFDTEGKINIDIKQK